MFPSAPYRTRVAPIRSCVYIALLLILRRLNNLRLFQIGAKCRTLRRYPPTVRRAIRILVPVRPDPVLGIRQRLIAQLQKLLQRSGGHRGPAAISLKGVVTQPLPIRRVEIQGHRRSRRVFSSNQSGLPTLTTTRTEKAVSTCCRAEAKIPLAAVSYHIWRRAAQVKNAAPSSESDRDGRLRRDGSGIIEEPDFQITGG